MTQLDKWKVEEKERIERQIVELGRKLEVLNGIKDTEGICQYCKKCDECPITYFRYSRKDFTYVCPSGSAKNNLAIDVWLNKEVG